MSASRPQGPRAPGPREPGFRSALLPWTLAALASSLLLRWHWERLHQLFASYPSDIWYIHLNYGWFLVNQPTFQMEYPAGFFALVKALSWIASLVAPLDEPHPLGGELYSYRAWLLVNAGALGLATLGAAWALHRLNRDFFHQPGRRLAWTWGLSPTLIYFSLFNYDAIPVFCTLAALLAWLRGQLAVASLVLGLGAAVKVYPAVLLILMIPGAPAGRRLPSLAWFCAGWGVLNLPLLALDPQAFLFPYQWQLGFEQTDQGGRLLDLLAALLTKPLALSLVGLGGLAGILAVGRRAPTEPREDPRWCGRAALSLLTWFLFTKSVFSPQYLFWLLPFLTLLGGYPWAGLATLIELVNAAEAFRLDYWRSGHEGGLVVIRAVRDLALLGLLASQVRGLLRGPDRPPGASLKGSP